MEKQYNGGWDSAMMGDYVWSLLYDTSTEYDRKTQLQCTFLAEILVAVIRLQKYLK